MKHNISKVVEYLKLIWKWRSRFAPISWEEPDRDRETQGRKRLKTSEQSYQAAQGKNSNWSDYHTTNKYYQQ